jgi:uncharacterized protein
MNPAPRPPVATKAELMRLLTANQSALRKLGVRRLGLFGSFRRGEPRPDSDVDLYVELAPGEATFDRFMDLGFFCEDLCGRRVEIVTPNSLSPHLGPHILKDVEYVLG